MTEAGIQRLAPEAPDIVPTVGVAAVWSDLRERIRVSPARRRLATMYAETEIPRKGKHADALGDQATADAILNICLRNGLFVPRIHSGSRFYKVPSEAFIPRFESAGGIPTAGATTWGRGILHRLDTTAPHEWIADGGFALLVTAAESEMIVACARDVISQEEHNERRDVRDILIDRARDGEITHEEAEAEAERQGLGLLAVRPPEGSFDPRRRPAWTLPMALAWIAWRDFVEVREWDPDYCEASRDWRPSEGGAVTPRARGWVLARRPVPTVHDFECFGYLTRLERQHGEIKRAPLDVDLPSVTKTDLWRALQDGQLVGHGIPRGGGARRNIPAIEWQDLENYRDRQGREQFRYHHEPLGGPAYFDLSVPRSDVIAGWPERSAPDPVQSRTIATETRAKTDLMAAAREHVENGAAAPVRAVWREECGLGSRASERVWKAVAEKYPAISSHSKPKRIRGA